VSPLHGQDEPDSDDDNERDDHDPEHLDDPIGNFNVELAQRDVDERHTGRDDDNSDEEFAESPYPDVAPAFAKLSEHESPTFQTAVSERASASALGAVELGPGGALGSASGLAWAPVGVSAQGKESGASVRLAAWRLSFWFRRFIADLRDNVLRDGFG
jgi:hypothetical protein